MKPSVTRSAATKRIQELEGCSASPLFARKGTRLVLTDQGSKLLAEAEAPLGQRLLWFGVVFAVTAALTVYTMVKSKRLSDFLDALSDERLGAWDKTRALLWVWRRGTDE